MFDPNDNGYKPDNNEKAIGYTKETQELLIKTYKDQIMMLTAASMKAFTDKEISDEKGMLAFIAAVCTGAFLIGFKKGNDLFIEETEKEKSSP